MKQDNKDYNPVAKGHNPRSFSYRQDVPHNVQRPPVPPLGCVKEKDCECSK